MYSRFLMTKATLDILWSSAVKITSGDQFTLLEEALRANNQLPSFVLRYYNTWKSKALLSSLPWPLFIGGSPRATQGALYPRRLYVGSSFATGAWL